MVAAGVGEGSRASDAEDCRDGDAGPCRGVGTLPAVTSLWQGGTSRTDGSLYIASDSPLTCVCREGACCMQSSYASQAPGCGASGSFSVPSASSKLWERYGLVAGGGTDAASHTWSASPARDVHAASAYVTLASQVEESGGGATTGRDFARISGATDTLVRVLKAGSKPTSGGLLVTRQAVALGGWVVLHLCTTSGFSVSS